MIRSASMKVGKKTHKLKFSTGALVRLEADNDGRPFDELIDRLLSGRGGVTLMVSALAAGLNDGKGMERDAVEDLLDQAGGARKMVPFLAEAVDAAFDLKKAEVSGDAEAGKTEPPAEA